MAAEQELHLIAVAEGFDQAAGQVKKLGDTVAGSAGATKLGNEQFRNLVGLLRDIDPGVGRLVDGFCRAIQFADALGKSNLNLKDILGQVTGGFSKMSGLLTVIGTGAGIAAGIALIAHAFGDLKREAAEVNKELERQRKTLDDLARGRATRAQTIEGISDQRRSGGLSVESSARATQAADAVSQQFRQLDSDAINKAAGTFGDAGLSTDEIAQAAFLIQTGRLNPKAGSSPASLRRQFDKSSTRFQNRIGEFFSRETQQGQGTGVAGGGQAAATPPALEQALNKEAGSTSLTDFIRNLPGAIGQEGDPEHMAEIVRGLFAVRGQRLPARDLVGWWDHIRKFAADDLNRESTAQTDIERTVRLLEREGITSNPAQVRSGEFVVNQLLKASRQAAPRPAPVINHYHMQNQRNYGPDAASFRGRIKNGETRGDQG